MAENKRKYEDEIDFKALTKNPRRLFGWVFPYIFVILVLVGIFYVNNLTEMSLNSAPVGVPSEDNVKRTIEMKAGSELPPIDLDILQNPSSELISKGKELYQQNCASCHGDEGQGDGPAGAALNPPPRDYYSTEGWTNGRKFSDMYKTLQEGIVENGMAAYEYIPPKERIAILHYTRTFTDFPPVTDEEVQEMDATYSLTKGVKTSNQIPVDLAMQKLLEERSHSQKIYHALDYINNHPNVEGANVFKKVASNRYRVLSSFYASNISLMELNEFVEIVSTNFNELGFNAEVSRLEQNEWQNLFSYLNDVLEMITTTSS